MKAASLSPSLWMKRTRAALADHVPTRAQRRHAAVGPAYLWREKRDFQIAFLNNHGLTPTSTVLDIGCGTLRGGIPIIDTIADGNYAGVELRAELEAPALAELADDNLTGKHPQLVFGQELSAVHLGRQFSIAWAYSVLIHLTDDHLDECFRFVDEHLAAGGVFFANVNLGENHPDRWAEFPVLWRTLDAYEAHAGRVRFRVENLGPLWKLGLKGDEGAAQKMLRFTRTG